MRKVRLGDYIEQCDENNTAGAKFPFMGINKDKEFMPTVANIEIVDRHKYKIINKGYFVFSGMQTGRDKCIRISLYKLNFPALISPAYTIFKIKESRGLLPEYFFLFFLREEMDRYGWFISDSSVRANLDWDRFCDIEIPLPDIEVQKELVAAWQGLKELADSNAQMADPLLALCQSYLKELKQKYEPQEIGPYIEQINERNEKESIKQVMGLNVSKKFREPQSRVDKNKLKPYKIVKKHQFVYVPTTDTWRCLAVALSLFDYDIVVSPIYNVFKIVNEEILTPEYLFLWLQKAETDRWARYNSWGSARENLSFDFLKRFKIPLPPIEVQKAIVAIYRCAQENKAIADEASALSKSICPALMRQAMAGGGQ